MAMLASEILPKHNKILNFWFGTPGDTVYGTTREIWWTSTPEFDQEIRDQFFEDYVKARDGEYDDWMNDPHASLALILLLDQFPRNLFRGTPEIYATDPKAVEVTSNAVEKGYDQQLQLPILRQFLFTPLLHSEDLEVQKKSVQLYATLDEYFGSNAYAKKYYETIQKFGRFPHRNNILGRTSTPEEIEFLKEFKFPDP